jgi:hypothetical protein
VALVEMVSAEGEFEETIEAKAGIVISFIGFIPKRFDMRYLGRATRDAAVSLEQRGEVIGNGGIQV